MDEKNSIDLAIETMRVMSHAYYVTFEKESGDRKYRRLFGIKASNHCEEYQEAIETLEKIKKSVVNLVPVEKP